MKLIFVRIIQLPIRIYSYLISPLLGRSCRFYPTCSKYMLEALETHGIFKGFLLGMLRISRCNPWNKRCWNDPVPKQFAWREIIGYKRKRRIRKSQYYEAVPHDE